MSDYYPDYAQIARERERKARTFDIRWCKTHESTARQKTLCDWRWGSPNGIKCEIVPAKVEL